MTVGITAFPAFAFNTLINSVKSTSTRSDLIKAEVFSDKTPLANFLKVSLQSDDKDEREVSKTIDVKKEYPLFVTWNKAYKSNFKDTSLRGCIGTFHPQSILSIELKRYALIAGLKDHRFDPIKASEIPLLECK